MAHDKEVREAVWKREVEYWKYHENGASEECVRMVDEKFLGCNSSGEKLDMDGLRKHVAKKAGSTHFTPDPKQVSTAVSDDGKVVVVLLDRITREKCTRRITHTWQLQERWVLLGGMSQKL